MGVNRKGTIARPGSYVYTDKEGKKHTEFKAAADLKRVAKNQPHIHLTMGHPKGDISEEDILGMVIPTWDSRIQELKGEFVFFDEYFNKLPKAIRDKVVNNKAVAISAGFGLDGVKSGTQEGAVYSHIAVLVDETPLCPDYICGVNVRQESIDMSYKKEEITEITEPSAKEEPTPREDKGFAELKAQVAELTGLVKTLVSPPKETVAVQEPEPEVKTPVEEVATVQPDPVPEKVIPAGTSSDDEIEMDGTWFVFGAGPSKTKETR